MGEPGPSPKLSADERGVPLSLFFQPDDEVPLRLLEEGPKNGKLSPAPLLRLAFREMPNAFKASPKPFLGFPFALPFVPFLLRFIPIEFTDSTDISLGRLSIPGLPAGMEPLA